MNTTILCYGKQYILAPIKNPIHIFLDHILLKHDLTTFESKKGITISNIHSEFEFTESTLYINIFYPELSKKSFTYGYYYQFNVTTGIATYLFSYKCITHAYFCIDICMFWLKIDLSKIMPDDTPGIPFPFFFPIYVDKSHSLEIKNIFSSNLGYFIQNIPLERLDTIFSK